MDQAASTLPPGNTLRGSWRVLARRDWLCLAVVVLPVCIIAGSRLLYPYNNSAAYEGHVIAPASLLARGENPYSLERAATPPFVVAVYGPAYYALVGVGVALLGEQMWFGRCLAILGALLAAWSVYRLAALMCSHQAAGRLGLALFVGQFPFQAWIATQRPDFVALGAGLAGMTLTLGKMEGRGPSACRSVVAGLLLATAILCRQTAFLPAVFAILWLGLRQRQRAAVTTSVTIILLLVSSTWLLDRTSAGGFLAQTLWTPSGLGRDLTIIARHLRGLFLAPASWLLSGLAMLGMAAPILRALRAWRTERPRLRPASGTPADALPFWFGCYAAVALLLAVITSSIPGSNLNYYLEPAAALSVLGPCAWVQSRTLLERATPMRAARATAGSWMSLGLIAAAIAASIPTHLRLMRGEYYRWQALPYYREIERTVGTHTPKDQPSFSVYPEILMRASREYYFNAYVPYDGRTPSLARIFQETLSSGTLAAVVVHGEIDLPGYRRFETRAPLPERVWPLILYLRVDLADRVPPSH